MPYVPWLSIFLDGDGQYEKDHFKELLVVSHLARPVRYSRPMHPLSLDSELPLTCTRSGSCCHGHRIAVTAWEIAMLARDMGMSPAECRNRYTEDGATRLRFNGLSDHVGRSACTFYSSESGCTVHQSRPLACRVYPLARRRDKEQSTFTFAGGVNPCLTRCPDVEQLPKQRLGEWLASQTLVPGLAAHDAYGDLVWGLLVTAAAIAASGDLAIGAIVSEVERRILLSGDERIPFLPPPWFDLLTVPELPVDPSDPVAFVGAHGRRLQQAIANDFALPPTLEEITLLILTMAIHLSPMVGINERTVISEFINQVAVGQASSRSLVKST